MEVSETKASSNYTSEQVKAVILAYAEEISHSQKIVATILKNVDGSLENGIFQYKAASEFEKLQIESIKATLQKYAREQKQMQLQIEITIDPTKIQTQTVLTASDKLKKIIEEFPVVAELQKALDLKLEY